MANWAGYDSTSFVYGPPRGGMGTTCNPSGYDLAAFAAHHYPQAANKYFCRYFQVTSGFSPFDPAEITSLRSIGFFYLLPISAPAGTRESTSGATGKTYGQQDATTACQNIVAALNSGRGLTTPSNNVLYVYLDIEAGVNITNWYWEGWSETIYNYWDPTWGAPFYPAVYANPSNTGTMSMLVSYNADAQHMCRGLWSTQPSASGGNCTWCNNAPPPGWSPTGFSGLTLHHWQYALDEVCYPPPSGPGCDACRPHVDNDQSNPAFEMTDYMLRIT